MNIISDANSDTRNTNRKPGGYEWWYFDGLSSDQKYSFVIIWYEGNPFSTRYIKELEDNNVPSPGPAQFPAMSISLYEHGKPVYYSFTEFEKQNCSFSKSFLSVTLGSHKLVGEKSGRELRYYLTLKEELPSGDFLNASITFQSECPEQFIFDKSEDGAPGHRWNLVQPRADVKMNASFSKTMGQIQKISFEGTGYHDHNTGNEPMRDEFADWYWGRFHFDQGTLVYYVMNRRESEQHQAWLIRNDNTEIIDHFEQVKFDDLSSSLFGLKTARKMTFNSQENKIVIQHSKLIDNGPFYQRFMSDAFLRQEDGNLLESASGICEYIRPGRIYNRIFWPLVRMRIRSEKEGPHWVQRSRRLYRWTW